MCIYICIINTCAYCRVLLTWSRMTKPHKCVLPLPGTPNPAQHLQEGPWVASFLRKGMAFCICCFSACGSHVKLYKQCSGLTIGPL